MPENNRKLPMKVVLSFALSSFGSNSMWMLINYFLLFFYTDVIKIPAAAATVILFIARVWDAVNDPMMGVLCDRTRSREGKSRFWLKRMVAPIFIILALAFFCPNLATPVRIAWAGVTYILLGMAQTAIGIPASSLIISMTDDRTQRVRIEQFSAVPSALANFLIPAMTMPFVRLFGEDNMRIGFFLLAAIIGLCYAAGTFLIYWNTKGLDPDTSDAALPEGQTQKGTGGLELIKEALQNKYCVLVSLAYLCYLLLSGIMGSTLIYYFRYNIGNDGLMSLYSITVFIGMAVAILTMRLLTKKFGNAMTCIIGGLICVLAFIPRIITKDQILPVFAVCMVLMGLGSGYIAQLMRQCIMDATTYGKLRGQDNQSVVMSLFTFSQKFGQAISSVIAAALLALFHYEEGSDPSPMILRLFYVENIIVPIVIAAAVISLLFVVHGLEKQTMAELAARQEAEE